MSIVLRILRRALLLAERGLYNSPLEIAPLLTNGLSEDYVRHELRSLDLEGRDYLELHLERLAYTLQRVPVAVRPRAEVLEIGSYGHFAAILVAELGYCVRGAYLGELGRTDRRLITAGGQPVADILVDLFNAERDTWPYENARFDGLLVCEVIEHLVRDPMWLLWEANRVLKPGGWMLLTTPNCASYRSLERALMRQENPQVFSRYNSRDLDDPPHVREYTVKELNWALTAAGFAVRGMETTREPGSSSPGWLGQILSSHRLPQEHRGEQIYCLAEKRTAPTERFPAFLYT